MLFHLILQIIHDIRSDSRPIDPVQHTQRPVVTLSLRHHMRVGPPRHALQHNRRWQNIVARVSEQFFEGEYGDKKQVGHHMKAEDDGREIEGQEAMEQVANWVVVGCNERVGDVDAVVPRLVPVGQGAACGGVEEVCMDVVLEDLVGSSVRVIGMMGRTAGLRCGIKRRLLRV